MNRPAPNTAGPVSASSALLALRRRAEDSQRINAPLPLHLTSDLTAPETRMLFHELRVHQVELELQNEELRRMQTELALAHERYFDLYDLAPVGYCTVNAQGQIVQANLTAATLLGLSRTALVNRSFIDLIPLAQQSLYHQCRQRVVDCEQAQTCELQMRSNDDAPLLWVSLAVNATQEADGTPLLRVMFSDISKRKQLVEALQQKNIELEHTRQLADQANRAKSEFLANMSHELRSPLNAILGFAQLMETGTPALTPPQKSAIDQILHSGWYLLELVNDILDLAGIESGKLSLELAPESLGGVLQECQNMIEPLAASNSIAVSFAAFEMPCMVQADRRRLKQVVVNLLTNAIKYNRPSGTVDVRWSLRPNGCVRISVQDSGNGLSADQLAQLFQPFNRLGQENGAREGTGIGLVVCKRLVELMGGKIGAQSTPGVGSTFWFELVVAESDSLPAASQATSAPPSKPAPQPMPSGPPVALHSLLCVEDHPATLALIEQLMARRGDIRLLVALDAESGLALAKLERPELILMDINLPGMSGLEALDLLRDNLATRQIPVLAITANAMPQDIEKVLAAGFMAYLTKPIKIDELMAAVDQGLALAAQSA